MRGKNFLVLLSLLPFSLITRGNNGNNGKTEPVLHGYVSDAYTKKPVTGVVISITSSKMQGEKEVTTDASGNFKIPQLPPGEVTIILEKKGYKTYRREGVILKEGVSIKMNFDMKVDNNDEEDGDVFHPLLRMMEGR